MDKTKIEWCDSTLNPLGQWCFGPGGTKQNIKTCDYCFAKRMAQRHMISCPKCHTFSEPHTHFDQLDKLHKWKKQRTIFIQSMGDLFHDSVADEWIRTVFNACAAVPRHRFLFLSKNPERYLKLQFDGMLPMSHWYGYSAETPDRFYYDYHYHASITNKFISIEPIHAGGWNILNDWPFFADWVIVGVETGRRKGKVIPEREWIEDIVNACRGAGVPIFMKNSLRDVWGNELIQELPWR